MADDVMKRSAEAQAASSAHAPGIVPAARESRADRARRLVYRGRFSLFYLLLAIVAGAAIGSLVVLVNRGSPAPAPPWSEWQPTGSPERQAAQIGDHVTDLYRLPSGRQLATVTFVGAPTATGPDGSSFQVRAIAVGPNSSGGQAESDIDTVDANSAVMFTLCGLGQACSIAEGQPSQARSALLRREALELALYSFTYIDAIDSVLVLLPPRPDGQAAAAVFIEQSDVRAELRRPLDKTLTAPLTPGIGEIAEDELHTIDQITAARLYEYAYLQAPDGSPVMVLSPVPSS